MRAEGEATVTGSIASEETNAATARWAGVAGAVWSATSDGGGGGGSSLGAASTAAARRRPPERREGAGTDARPRRRMWAPSVHDDDDDDDSRRAPWTDARDAASVPAAVEGIVACVANITRDDRVSNAACPRMCARTRTATNVDKTSR